MTKENRKTSQETRAALDEGEEEEVRLCIGGKLNNH